MNEPSPAASIVERVSLAGVRAELLAPTQAIVELGDMIWAHAKDLPRPDFLHDVQLIRTHAQHLAALVETHLQPGRSDSALRDDAALRTQVRHDLRNALNGILGYAELWLEDESDAELARFAPDLQLIRSSGRNCLTVVDRVLGDLGDQGAKPAAGESERAHAEGVVRQFVDALQHPRRGSAVHGHILVVDDQESNRQVLARRLQLLGHSVSTAAGGVEALAALSGGGIDLVLLDVLMPDLNGLQVLERMMANPVLAEVPIIMVSGIREVDLIAPFIERGAEDFLTKPIDPVLVGARVAASLEKKHLRDREKLHLQQIEREKQRADDLLHVIFPEDIVTELKTTNTVAPRRHDNVAVLFADIVGFTSYCEAHPAERVIDCLQGVVEVWEEIAREHGVDKIKTVGDAFMAVSGMLRPSENPVLDCVRCGLAMIRSAERAEAGWRLRVGIHIGSVVAGKLGGRQYSFDLWGDTVNTAARMESHGLPGAITLSANAWCHLAALCRTEREPGLPPKGVGHIQTIPVKGKGTMEVVRFTGFAE